MFMLVRKAQTCFNPVFPLWLEGHILKRLLALDKRNVEEEAVHLLNSSMFPSNEVFTC